MHLYLDTSALVKKYFWEIGSTDVTALWIQADSLSTSFVAYAETLAAFYRKHRETPIQKHIFQAILDTFHKDWDSFIRVEVNKELCRHIDRLLDTVTSFTRF